MKKSVSYNFCSWWQEGIKNPFPETLKEEHRHLYLIFDDRWDELNSLDLDFSTEAKLLPFIAKAEQCIKDSNLNIIWGDHGIAPLAGEVIVCVRKIETSLWKPKENV